MALSGNQLTRLSAYGTPLVALGVYRRLDQVVVAYIASTLSLFAPIVALIGEEIIISIRRTAQVLFENRSVFVKKRKHGG